MSNIKRYSDYTANTKHIFLLRNTNSMETLFRLADTFNGAVVKFGNNVLFAGAAGHKFIGAVYEFVETEEETGLSYIELCLNLVAMSEDGFEDSGHAIAWAMQQVSQR